MGSSRFHGKPIAQICGISMIEHVYRRSIQSQCLDALYIATCDEEIKQVAESVGAKVIMTKATHEGASDRVAEAMLKHEEMTGKKVDAVVMIQGDEPMIFPEMIDQSCAPVKENDEVLVTNLFAAIKTKQEHEDPNEIKVAVNKDNWALFFTREPIPTRKKGASDILMLKQVCVITFRRDFLIQFNAWPQTPLEKIEGIDMLRVLENGYGVKMVPTEFETYSVDTPEDLAKVESLLKNDKLVDQYLNVK